MPLYAIMTHAQTFPPLPALLDIARSETGLSDFGDEWFFPHIERLTDALARDARLSEAGFAGAQGMIIGALCARLRHIELIKRQPEIKDIPLNVAAVVVGLPRTGSTMMHRMLAAAPNMTGARWYETQNYSPLKGESRDDPTPRKEAAQMIMEHMLAQIPELMSIHPMSLDQPDEEVIMLGQLFSSTMIESTYFVPSYTEWLKTQNPRRAYENLYEILQSLQWQDKTRYHNPAIKWILKTPGHLIALPVVLDLFPQAKIVMTHRDPVATVPSYCSMEASLYRMGSDDISYEMIGRYWLTRLYEWIEAFMSARAEADESRFIDVYYPDLLANPVAEGERVLQAANVPLTEAVRDNMNEWIEANKREDRAPHKYEMADFNLTEDMIKEKFAAYRQAYIS